MHRVLLSDSKMPPGQADGGSKRTHPFVPLPLLMWCMDSWDGCEVDNVRPRQVGPQSRKALGSCLSGGRKGW